MSLVIPPLRRNGPFRTVNQPKANPFLSLRSIPILIVLASGLAIQPAARANPVVDTIPVDAPSFAGSVGGIVASPDHQRVFVADFLSNRIAVISTSANQILGLITTANPPNALTISPDGNTLYASESNNNSLEAILLRTGTHLFSVPVGNLPEFPGISADGSTVYVPNQLDGTVTPVGGPLSSPITVGGGPWQAVFNPNGTTAYVSNEAGYISVIDTATGTFANIGVATQVFGLALKGATLYATGVNAVYVIDTKTNTVADTIQVPNPANAFFGFPALTPDGAFLYVPVAHIPPNHPGQDVFVINTITNRVVGQLIPVGLGAVQVAAAANDVFGYVANGFDGTVTVLKLRHPR